MNGMKILNVKKTQPTRLSVFRIKIAQRKIILICFSAATVTFRFKNDWDMGVERAAGFLIFRRSNEKIEYLLLRASKKTKHWSPPKGTQTHAF